MSELYTVSIAHNCPAQPHTTGQRRFFHGRRPLSVPPVGPSRPSGPLTRHRQPDTIRRNNVVCWTRGAAAVVLASTGVPIHWVPLLEARGIVVARSFSCSGGSPTIGISRPCNSTLAAFMAVVQGGAVLGPVQGRLPALQRAGRGRGHGHGGSCTGPAFFGRRGPQKGPWGGGGVLVSLVLQAGRASGACRAS